MLGAKVLGAWGLRWDIQTVIAALGGAVAGTWLARTISYSVTNPWPGARSQRSVM